MSRYQFVRFDLPPDTQGGQVTFNPRIKPTPVLDEFLAWLDEDRNNWIRAGIGDYSNALDEAVEQIEHLSAEVDRLTPRTISTPAEADKTTAGTVLLDKIGDVWQHGVERQTLWEDRIDYWTTPGDEEGHDARHIVYPAHIIYQPEDQTDE